MLRRNPQSWRRVSIDGLGNVPTLFVLTVLRALECEAAQLALICALEEKALHTGPGRQMDHELLAAFPLFREHLEWKLGSEGSSRPFSVVHV